MKCYIRKDEVLESEEFLDAKRITIVASSSDLKKLSSFLSQAADTIDNQNYESGHIHLLDSDFKLDSNFDVVIMQDQLF